MSKGFKYGQQLNHLARWVHHKTQWRKDHWDSGPSDEFLAEKEERLLNNSDSEHLQQQKWVGQGQFRESQTQSRNKAFIKRRYQS